MVINDVLMGYSDDTFHDINIHTHLQCCLTMALTWLNSMDHGTWWSCWATRGGTTRGVRFREVHEIDTGREAPVYEIAKLLNITPITMVYGTYNYSYCGL